MEEIKMEILKHGKYYIENKKKIKCFNCNCVFITDIEDENKFRECWNRADILHLK